MKISDNGLKMIKTYEGFSARATKCVDTEKYYTIGYGHYGKDVEKDEIISVKEAEKLLAKDVAVHEKNVNALDLNMKQNTFDALVDFSYNCGKANLTKLTKGRTLKEISEHITAYNKSGGVVLAGLTKRRKAEKELIDKDLTTTNVTYFNKYTGASTSIVIALKYLGYSSTYTYRKKIAEKNGIKNYTGLASQNTTLLKLLKAGKLIKP